MKRAVVLALVWLIIPWEAFGQGFYPTTATVPEFPPAATAQAPTEALPPGLGIAQPGYPVPAATAPVEPLPNWQRPILPQAQPPVMLDTVPPRPDALQGAATLGPRAAVGQSLPIVAPPTALDTIPPGINAAGPAVLPPDAGVRVDSPEPPPKIWEGSFELGVNGTGGNSETFNVRTGSKVKRKTDWSILSSELDYHQNNAGSTQTANQALLESRYELLFKPSAWTWFVHNTLEYDEFKPFDLRLGADTGLGYQFIKDDFTTFTGRLGGGTSREFGGVDEEWKPEAVFGLEFEHKITKTHKISLAMDYMPNVTDFNDYRMKAKASWEILLDEESHLSLKINAIDRYDSTPDGSLANDIDYSLVLLWSF